MSGTRPESSKWPYFVFGVGIVEAHPAEFYSLLARELQAKLFSKEDLRTDLWGVKHRRDGRRKPSPGHIKHHLYPRARLCLQAGKNVVTDCVFNTPTSRERALESLRGEENLGLTAVALYGITSSEIIAGRIKRGNSLPNEIRRVESALQEAIKPDSEKDIHVIEVDGSLDNPEAAVAWVLEQLGIIPAADGDALG